MKTFYDANERPPQGGWHYFYDPATRNRMVQGGSATAVFEGIKRFRVNNNSFAGDAALWDELWNYWCAREPARCLDTVGAAPSPPPVLTPSVYGAWIWRFLNWSAVHFNKPFFLTLCGEILRLLDCPLCRQEWSHILSDHPPYNLETSRDACQWVNQVHNLVNARIGKPQYPYARGITEYGFPS